MDPITALGLASSIAQFVTFGYNITANALEIYKSADGKTEELKLLQDQIVALCGCAQEARDTALADQARALSTPSQAENALLEIALDCGTLADDFDRATKNLMVRGKPGLIRSIRTAWNVWRKKFDILAFDKRLDEFRLRLGEQLSVVLYSGQTDLAFSVDQLGRMHRGTEIRVLHEFDSVKIVLDSLSKRTDESAADFNNVAQEIKMALNCSKTQIILQSLYFTHMEDRGDSLNEAHARTFEWILDVDGQEGNGSRPKVHFLEWLKSGDGISWISGKAGSAKSTLIKYIRQDPRTQSALCAWAGSSRLVVKGHYFWISGVPLQKSQQGLFQALLYVVRRRKKAWRSG